jgi:hypothetical protein
MTESDFHFLKVLVLLAPVMVFAAAVLTVLLTSWMDARSDRRHARERAEHAAE